MGASAAGPDGEVRLAAPLRGGHQGQAVRSVLAMAAPAAAGGGRGDVPVRSRGRLLAEILVAPRERTARLAARGRALGLPVDGHHIALRYETGAPGERYETLEPVMPEALTLLRDWSAGGAEAGTSAEPTAVRWNAALADDALILLATWPTAPGPEERRRLGDDVRRLTDRLQRDHPAALRCGVGGAHRGVLGIRATAREAAAALLRDPAAPVAVHDAAGLDRMLTEWYVSDSAHEAVGELLAPVLALGPERAEPLIRTLQAYWTTTTLPPAPPRPCTCTATPSAPGSAGSSNSPAPTSPTRRYGSPCNSPAGPSPRAPTAGPHRGHPPRAAPPGAVRRPDARPGAGAPNPTQESPVSAQEAPRTPSVCPARGGQAGDANGVRTDADRRPVASPRPPLSGGWLPVWHAGPERRGGTEDSVPTPGKRGKGTHVRRDTR
ncbi:hypothetical protein JCM12681A_68190 [Streptomyces mexicanus]